MHLTFKGYVLFGDGKWTSISIYDMVSIDEASDKVASSVAAMRRAGRDIVTWFVEKAK